MNGTQPYVLVVDDAANSLAELLAIWGYTAEARYCGVAALAAVRERRPAVVLLDLRMAPIDGFTFAAQLRELPGCERTAVVAISGHTSEAHQARCRDLGINHYLFKPADLSVLQALLTLLTLEPKPTGSRTENRRRREQRRTDSHTVV